ncbi:conserved domain protein [delta proteobacterium NaphS2]|nr:conserved domain protein [delta proteobacterium NaphS2]
MLRVARVEKAAVTEACRLFGFSREYFYRLERDFMSNGYASKRQPKIDPSMI